MHPGDGVVHLCHLEFVLEVRHGAKALDDEVGLDLFGEVDHQRREHRDAHVAEMADGLLDHLLTFVEAERAATLLRVAHRSHDHLVEQFRRCRDDLDMAVVDRVERARIQNTSHGVSPCALAVASVTTVPP